MSEKAKLTSHTLPDIRMVSSIWPSGYRTMTFLRRQGQGFPLLSEPLGDLRPSKAPSPPPPSQCASPATSLPLSPLPYHHHCLLLTHFPSFVPSASSFFSSPNPPPLTSYTFFLKLKLSTYLHFLDQSGHDSTWSFYPFADVEVSQILSNSIINPPSVATDFSRQKFYYQNSIMRLASRTGSTVSYSGPALNLFLDWRLPLNKAPICLFWSRGQSKAEQGGRGVLLWYQPNPTKSILTEVLLLPWPRRRRVTQVGEPIGY